MGETSGTVRAGAPPPMPLAFFGFATAFMGIALYLIIEVNVTVLRFFKKRGGLYFWCILISSWGTCLHTIAFIIQWWVPSSPWILCAALGQFGWSFMVTGQSLVLYSRLHLVIRNHKILRSALIMIITTSIAVEVPNWVTSWFAYNTKLSVTELWTPRDNIMLRISQLVIFLQEAALSMLYIWGTVRILAPNDRINVRRIKWDLIAISSFIIATDLVNVILTYAEEHYAKEPIQNFSYAFKLRIEFAVLNQLMSVTSQFRASKYNGAGRYTAALTRGPNPYAPVQHHPSDQSGSISSRGDHELDKLPRARLESSRPRADAPLSPSHEKIDDGIMVKHDLQQQQDVPHTTTSSSQPYGSSENLASNSHARAVASPSRESWWRRLVRQVDPPSEERWRRDYSRV